MILTYHDGFCVRASAGDTTVVFGPVSKASKHFKPINFSADVVFTSLNHGDMNGWEDVRRPRLESTAPNGAGKQPFVIQGPGEYEIKDIAAFGFGSASHYGGQERINTIYSVAFDGLTVAYLGALSGTDLPKELLEMDEPDILIVPLATDTLTPAEAQKVAVQLEAKLVIPIAYDDKTLKQFLKEAGAEDVKPEEKLTLKKKDVAGKENEIVLLKA